MTDCHLAETHCDCQSSYLTPKKDVRSMTEDDAMMLQLLGLQTSKSCTTLWLSASLDHNLRRLFHLSPGDQFRQPVANRSNLFVRVGDDVHSLQPACVKSDRASANITLKQACTLNKRRVWWRAQARCRQCWTASWTATAGHCKAEDDWRWESRR